MKSVESLIESLRVDKLRDLSDIILTASIKREFGEDWRGFIRKERLKSLGKLKKVYSFIEGLSEEQFDIVSYHMARTNND